MIRKHFFVTIILRVFSLIFILVSSCNERTQTSDLGINGKEEISNKFSWEAIRSKSMREINAYNLDSIDLEKLNLVDSAFFKSVLKNANSFKLYFPDSMIDGNFYYYEFIEKDNYHLMSLLLKDENCCLTLYYLTLDKVSGEVKDTKLIATQGSDGNWKEIDKGIRFSQNDVRIIKMVEEETGDRVSKDSLIVNFHVNDNGDIIKSVIDSIRIM